MFDFISDCIDWTFDTINDILDFFVEYPLIPVILCAIILSIIGGMGFSSKKSKTITNSSHYSEKTNNKYYSDPFNTEYTEEVKEEPKDTNSITIEVEVSTEERKEKPFTYHIVSIMDGKKDIELYCENYHYDGDDIVIEDIFKKNCCKEKIDRIITKKSLVRRIEDKTAKSEKTVKSGDCFIKTLMD